jgi:PKD repeat protein
MNKFNIGFLAIFMLLINTINAQDYSVNFLSGKVIFPENVKDYKSILQVSPNEIVNGKIYRFVQFYEIPTLDKYKNLETLGFEFLEYIPTNTYLVAIPTSFDFASLSDFGVRSLMPLEKQHKVDIKLEERPFPIWASQGNKVFVQIVFQQNLNFYASISALKKLGYEAFEFNENGKTAVISILPEKINELAKMNFIRYLSLPSEPGMPESDHGRNLHRSNMIDRDYSGSFAFDGSGVNVCINDDGFAGPHIDFEGRTSQSTVANDLTGNHGDGCAGIVGAAGNLNPLNRGMATGSYMHIRQYQSALPNTITLHVDSSVMYFSNSYSNGCNGGYTATTRLVDQEIYNNPSLMQIFSAGNSNNTDCGYGAGTQWGNITGGHKLGKNCIATANLDQNDVIASSSSRGPATDGRIKPDISAHGQNQISNDSDNTYQTFGGTSAACPGITGIMAQLMQAYRSFNAGQNAPSALLKAALMNTANEMGNDGPDFTFGWGKVNAFKALNLLQENRYITSTITQGASATHTINIPANVSRARIMIYWADKEASVSSSRNLVNNLNMTVSSPSAVVHHPWILNSAPNATTLAQVATRNGVLDSLNNVEQVAIDNPDAGVYTINVNGTAVPFGPQTYYIVYEFFTDEITVTFPVGGEGLLPNTTDKIHWDAYGNSGTFLVESSTNNGATWTVVSAAVAGTARFVNYNVPNVLTGQALVRVTRNGLSDTSDANFSIIARPANLRVDAVCASTSAIRLKWDAVANANGYDVFKLGSMYMDSVGSTTGATTFDVPVPNVGSTYWFAVRARGANNCVGLRTIAIKYEGSINNSGCFVDCGNDNDAGVTEIYSPLAQQQSCNGNNIDVSIQLSNISNNYQTAFPVFYSINNATPVMQMFNDTLFAGTQRNFTFTQQANFPNAGNYSIRIWSGLSTDGATCNDTMQMNINFTNPNASLPYAENFQSGIFPPVNSFLINPDGLDTWETKICTGSNGSSTTAMFVDNFAYNAIGQSDVFELVSLDLNSAVGADLKFDLSYAQYNSTYTDTLKVQVSTDCGQTYNTVYSKTGAQLATTANSTTTFTPNNAAQWRNETINLTAYVGNFVSIRFVNVNDYGNNVYIDNINIRSFTSVPQAAFNQNNSTVCAGTAVNFNDQSTGNPTSWLWNFGNAAVSNLQNPTYTYNDGGVYNVSLIVSNPAGSDTLTQTALITVLEADFSSNASTSALNVSFTDLSFGANSWSWDFGDGNSSTQQNPSHNYSAAGTYTVVLTINGQCTKTMQITVGAVDVSNLNPSIFEVNLLPNPASDYLRIDFSSYLTESVNLEIISMDGRIIKSVLIPESTLNYELDCSDLSEAVYFVRLKSDNYILSKKLHIVK